MSALVPFRSTVPTQLDKLFDNLFQEFWKTPAFIFERNWRPTDIQETDKGYKIEIELPRVKKEDLKVEVVNGQTLTVTVKTDKLSFVRTFQYGDMDAEKATVKLADGVLTVEVPKTPSSVKQLSIETG